MTKIGILPNKDKDINLDYTKNIVLWLLEKGYKPYILSEFSNIIKGCIYFENMQDLCKESDFVVVLGGDGTLLHKASICALFNTPLIGINLGTLGYLTDVDKASWQVALEKIFNNQYVIERRMMLEAHIRGEDSNFSNIALNDICIIRGPLSKIITVKLEINKQYIDTYKADGIIIASPSGSTAYNFSAGGPVIKPDLDLMVITPICPHKVYSRSSVVSGDDIVSIHIDDNSNDDVLIAVDGKNNISLKKGQTLNISKSKYYTSIIRTNNLGFYDILRNKFSIS